MYSLSLAVICGVGVLLIIFGLNSGGSGEKKRLIEDENGNLRTVSLRDSSVIKSMLADLSKKIRPDSGSLDSRLRRSGFIFETTADYHAKRMSYAIVFGMAPIVVGAVFKWSFLSVAVIASGMVIFGFMYPDRQIDGAISKRRKIILREMSFGLERVSLSLTSGANINAALSSAKNVGSFGFICEKLATNLNTGHSVKATIREIQDDLPRTTQMDEFLELIKQGITKGQDLVKPFQTTATILRDRLEMEVVEAGQKAKIKVTLLTSGFIVAASMLVAIGPIIISIMDSGIF